MDTFLGQLTRQGDGEVKRRRASEIEAGLPSHGHTRAVNDRSETPVDSH